MRGHFFVYRNIKSKYKCNLSAWAGSERPRGNQNSLWIFLFGNSAIGQEKIVDVI